VNEQHRGGNDRHASEIEGLIAGQPRRPGGRQQRPPAEHDRGGIDETLEEDPETEGSEREIQTGEADGRDGEDAPTGTATRPAAVSASGHGHPWPTTRWLNVVAPTAASPAWHSETCPEVTTSNRRETNKRAKTAASV